MTKMTKASVALLSGLLLMGIMAPVPSSHAASEKDMIQTRIQEQLRSKEKIKEVYYVDYDRNGRKEAFVLTGTEPKNEFDSGDNRLWFAYVENGQVQATEQQDEVEANHTSVLKLKDATLFCVGQYATTSSPQEVLRVNGNEVSVVFKGDTIKTFKGNSFTSVHSTYDMMSDGTGHTWKPYYFYYKNGSVLQYTAKKKSVSWVKKYKNGKKMLKKYKKRGAVKSVLYRANGLVHINYAKKGEYGTTYTNVTFQVKKKKLVKAEENDGKYLKKM